MAAAMFGVPATAQAWQIWYANYTSFGGYNHWQYAGGSGTKYGVVPMYSTVWSTGEQVNVGGNVWAKIYWNGNWGWCVHLLQGYGYSFSYRGVTSTPWSAPTIPSNGSSVNDRRSQIRWNYGDPDGGASDAANIQIATDAGFGSLIRNGGTNLGAYDPDWSMGPGQYWWRTQTHSWVNGWGAWSGASTFIVRHPTQVAISVPDAAPSIGTTSIVTFTAQKWLDGEYKGTAGEMPLVIDSSSDGVNWTRVASVNTDASGDYEYVTQPFASTSSVYYRGSLGETQWNSGSEGSISMAPKYPSRTVVWASSFAPEIGSQVTIKCQVQRVSGDVYTAATEGTPITIQKSSDGIRWVDVASGQTESLGLYSLDTSFESTASVYYRAVAGASFSNAGSTSEAIVIAPKYRTAIQARQTLIRPNAYSSTLLEFTVRRLVGSTYQPTAGSLVTLKKFDGSKWVVYSQRTDDASGTCVFAVSASKKTSFTAVAAMTSQDGPSTSQIVVVKPRALVGVPGAPRNGRRGVALSVKGTLRPRHSSGAYPVTIKAYMWNVATKKWIYHSSFKGKAYNFSSYSGYVGRFAPPRGFRYWSFRAYSPEDSQHSASKLGGRSSWTWVP